MCVYASLSIFCLSTLKSKFPEAWPEFSPVLLTLASPMPSSVYHIEDNQYLLKEKNEHTNYFSEQQILLSHHLEVS